MIVSLFKSLKAAWSRIISSFSQSKEIQKNDQQISV